MLLRVVAMLVCSALLFAVDLHASPLDRAAKTTGDRRVEQDRLALEAKRLALEEQSLAQRTAAEQNRLAFEREKASREHDLEEKRLRATVFSVAAPALVAALAYVFQVWARRRDEKLQFQLKAAEIVMDVRDSDVAQRKARFLSQLFPERLRSLSAGLGSDSDTTYFGPAMERREELHRLLAEHPEGRAEIIRAWEVLFPWSTDKDWFVALKADAILNRNATPATTLTRPGTGGT